MPMLTPTWAHGMIHASTHHSWLCWSFMARFRTSCTLIASHMYFDRITDDSIILIGDTIVGGAE
jgi:hypothetical protein